MNDTRFADRANETPVLVIGAAGLDMVGRLKGLSCTSEFQAGKSHPADIRASFGGDARNVAENLARLGQPVRLLTAVGKDQLGKDMLAYTAACGVDVSACVVSEKHLSSSYLAVLDAEGDRYLALEDMDILEELTPTLLRQKKDLILSSSLVFIDANLSPKALKTLFTIATKARVPVCADAASMLLAERLVPYLPELTMISANLVESTILCQGDPVVTDRETALQAARKFINLGVDLAVIALGEQGVVYATSEISGHVPAVQTRILDPTGAGDAMVATVLFGLLNQIPIDEAVRLGVTAASLILRHPGTVLPYLSLEKLYDELLI
jgi:pseudouridine kinase